MKKNLWLAFFLLNFAPLVAQQRWTVDRIDNWYAQQPWLIGCNYIPANSINELEMWQGDTFDPTQIEKELGWAESIGMNTVRVFLHDLIWEQDAAAFRKRIDQFLVICERHKIKPMFVLFDSVWDPDPKLGKQRDPKPGVHNSGWVQSPGAAALKDEKEYPRLAAYVKGVVGAYAKDPRVLCWDIWNEPDNFNVNNYAEPRNKLELIEKLLPLAFQWARSAGPTQPLTSGVWQIKVGDAKSFSKIEAIQMNESDFITFHNYGDSAGFKKEIEFLKEWKRPLVCTEYLARGNKSTFETILPVGKATATGMINWGFVAGKTQTNLPWDSWQKPYINGREPAIWHHEIFLPNGKPYRTEETTFIRRMTAGNKSF